MDYGKSLKAARKWAGLTQEALATKAKIATITIRQYEAGKRKPSTEIWFSIADALNLSIDELNNAELLPTKLPDSEITIDEIDKEEKTALFNNLSLAFSKLNSSGQQEAVKRIKELAEIPKYTVRFEPLTSDEKQLAETGQWGKLWDLQFGSRDSAEKPET